MVSPGVVYVDEDNGSYRDLKLPKNWRVHREPEWRSLQGALEWCLAEYPDASQYGWLADDTRPRTTGWDRMLEAEAADWNLAYARDLWISEEPAEAVRLVLGKNLSSGLCWGGELVRTVGWWALPGVRQAGIDTAWCEIARPFGLHRYVENVVVEHLNWRTGKRKKDETDNWDRDGIGYVDRDIVATREWLASEDYRNLLHRLVDAGMPPGPRLELALGQSVADSMFMRTGGVKAHVIDGLNKLEAQVLRDLADQGSP